MSKINISPVKDNAPTKKDAFAAVIVPKGLTKAGLSFAICSIDDGLIPLSLVTGLGTSVKYNQFSNMLFPITA